MITSVIIQVTLSTTGKAGEFTFSRDWHVPRLVLELSSGRLAVCNITFMDSDASLAIEDILIGLPILRHLGIDSWSLLECNCAKLNGTDCSNVPNPLSCKTAAPWADW